ncbi:hypothetical protein KIN20_000635 [Parelaphostrongylus tenuis]|uniref:Major facilitator superfamily (MFS) profile domain-containing protein n=1 Tax=Parelaphostrongylus tenuis TaxID=148309 RepID=A0AAD5MBN2_PARTN|nr:hypothetical protein KIN20_000635 [Parelaphostrongylus tenuis]
MYFFNRTRYVVLILAITCLTLIVSNSIALNFTIICMDDVRLGYYQQQSIYNNTNISSPHWIESSTHKNALFSAIAIGCLIGTLPCTYIIHKIGLRGTMTVYGAASVIATLALPFAARTGFVYVFIARVLQGVGTALSFPTTGLIASQWSTVRASGTFIAVLSCHVQLCSIFTMPVAGALCESPWGWPAVFYLQGALTALAFLAFFFFYTDDPSVHRNVSQNELRKITDGKCKQTKHVAPYRAIACDRCIIAIWLSSFGGNFGFQTFLLYGPTYMNKFTVGPISDRTTCISDRLLLIIFAAFSQGAMAIAVISLAFIRSPELGQLAYTLAIVFSGVNVVGTMKCAQMVARQHVHIVMTVISFFLCITVLLIPVAVNIVCPDDTPEQWSRFFLGVAAIIIISNIPFPFVARSEPAPWTSDKIHVLPQKIGTVVVSDEKRGEGI